MGADRFSDLLSYPWEKRYIFDIYFYYAILLKQKKPLFMQSNNACDP